ncbi:MAG: hypothetical protein PHQ52_03305 [Candidatus Omnitrophica bacterium]|nr:hypothetical protein [Candidatus Omnitrophota bacterium]
MKKFLLGKKGFTFLEVIIASMFFTFVASGVFMIYAQQQQILERAELQLTVSEVLRTLSNSVYVYWSLEQNNIAGLSYEYMFPNNLSSTIGTPQQITDANVSTLLNSTRSLADLTGSAYFSEESKIEIQINTPLEQSFFQYQDDIYMTTVDTGSWEYETIQTKANYTVREGTFPVSLFLTWTPPGSLNQVTESISFTTGEYSIWIADPVPEDSGVLGDLNNDTKVDLNDLTILQAMKGLTSTDPGFNHKADLNEDSVINDDDETILLAQYSSV